jgi:hypothetical protein
MALIVQYPLNPTETANSYQSLAEYRARAAIIGVTLPDDETEAEQKILIGQQYVDNKDFIGETVIAFQGTEWPRSNIVEYKGDKEYVYSDESIPQQVIDAVLYVAAEDDVYVTQTGGKRVQSKKIDVIETTYFDDGAQAIGFKRVTRADSLLSRFVSKAPNFFYVV